MDTRFFRSALKMAENVSGIYDYHDSQFPGYLCVSLHNEKDATV